MGNGNGNVSSGLDRILKLWISVWKLVLEDKRHYESVCALLQRLVSEKTAWPKHKNWPVICQLGKTEPLMQRIIQDLDISQITERNARIIAAFADCFSQAPVSGIPLSVIIDHIVEERIRDPDCEDEEGDVHVREHVQRGSSLVFLRKDGVSYIDDFGFPLTFLYDEGVDLTHDAETEGRGQVPRFTCPNGISSTEASGWTMIVFQDKVYVVVEIDHDCQRLTIVPAEYIALDL